MRKVLPFAALAALALAGACSENSLTGLAHEPFVITPVFDDIPNSLDGSLDAEAEVMPLMVGGVNGTTQLSVMPRGGDGKPGCNLTGSTTLVVAVSSSNTSVATVSPTSITFESCGDIHTLTVTPVAEGMATISLAQTSNNTGGTFDLAPATFTVNVSPATPTNTPPSLTITGVSSGGTYEKGAVPAAVCNVTDAEDGNSTFPATLSAITGPNAADGLGSQTASCSYTDAGGLMASSSVMYDIVDLSPPVISYVLNPPSPDGNNGWYMSAVTLMWTVTDSESPNSLQLTGCVDQSITADQTEITYSCSATSAGGSSGPVDVSIKRDATAPTISGSRSPAANAYGWNNTDVMVSFTCDDNLSGVASCGPDQTLSNEGAGQSAAGTAVDEAGNSAYTSVTGINIDKTAPSVSLVGGPADGASYSFGSVPAVPTCSASDALSGLVGSCSVSGYGTAVGTHTVTASATDMAGNSSSATSTYTVDPWYLSGFYQPVGLPNSFVVAAPGMLPTANSSTVWNSVKSGSTVPLKFHVFTANGGNEITTVSGAFNSSNPFSVLKITCSSNTNEDAVEFTTTGGTSLRYDAVEGQFIQNWQTPSKQAGSCYRTSLKTMDGSYLVAFFKLK
jgi:hypothetical protein